MDLSGLKKALIGVEDSYYGFVVGIMVYAEKKPERDAAIAEFLEANPDALTSDIIEFVSKQPDFYEESAREFAI